MIRILHTIDTTGPGGAETVFVNLVKGLDRRRYRSFAVISGVGWVCDTLKLHGIEPIFVQSRGKCSYKYLFRLVRIIRENKIDVIQSHLLGPNLYCSLAGAICRIPTISTFHGFVDTNGSKFMLTVKSRIINLGSKKILFVSNRLRKHFIDTLHTKAEKAVTVYNGIDTHRFNPEKEHAIRDRLNLGRDDILIGAIGNIRPAKGYEYLLEAAGRVAAKYPNAKFVIAGEGKKRDIQRLLSRRHELGLNANVFLIGYAADAAEVFKNIDIFVLPSISEGFSISTVEAMACGLPVVVTRSGGPEEIVVHNENGLIADPGDAGDLARNLILLIRSHRKREKFGCAARMAVEKRFTLEKMIAEYQTLYRTS